MKPNIIEIIWHDLGQHLNCYGWDNVNSPHLNQLAEEGTMLTNMFCTAPQCSPSRSSIMTGCYPHSNGMMGLAHLGWGYNKGQRTITQILKENGYKTFLNGFQHEADRKSDQYLKEKLGYDHILSDTADFFKNRIAQDAPFFLSIGFSDVHRPNVAEVSQKDIDNAELPAYIPGNDGTKKDMAQFEKMIEKADRKVGKILDKIKNTGLEEDTIIFFTTDHGPEFNRAKMTLYDPGIKVATILKWPGKIPANRVLAGMYSNIDILPTILDLAGITIPEFIQGESFKGSLTGREEKSRDYVIAEKTYHVIYDPMRCIRTDNYKYILNYRPAVPIQVSVQHSFRMGFDLAGQLYGKKRDEEELYDLNNDPEEKNNLAYNEKYLQVKEVLKNKLLTVLRETGDPLLAGSISPRMKIAAQYDWVFDSKAGHFKIEITDCCPDKLLS